MQLGRQEWLSIDSAGKIAKATSRLPDCKDNCADSKPDWTHTQSCALKEQLLSTLPIGCSDAPANITAQTFALNELQWSQDQSTTPMSNIVCAVPQMTDEHAEQHLGGPDAVRVVVDHRCELQQVRRAAWAVRSDLHTA